MKKIAFCFLSRQEILTENYWIEFFKNIDTNKYNIYIHCDIDYNMKSDFSKYEIKDKVLKFSNKSIESRLRLMKNVIKIIIKLYFYLMI